MKIRNGFVSNSSSSSFVLLGVKYKGAKDINEFAEENSLDAPYDTGLIGFLLARVSSDSYDCNEEPFDLKVLAYRVEKLKKVFGKDADIKLYSGIMES